MANGSASNGSASNGAASNGSASGAAAASGSRIPAVAVSPWAPLGITVFRVLWFAQLGSNIGTWMQTVGAQWFLVESAAGATIIALVQTASLTPSLLFSLPAGVLSDSVDRRRLLIWGSLASAAVATALTALTAVNALTPVLLLAFTFVLGVTAAVTGPAWQAIQPELVPRNQIAAASGLGGITVNGARAVGPALAGVLLATTGTAVVFGINAPSFVAAVAALLWWRRAPQTGLDDPEPAWAALRAGLRYVASAHLIRRILLRSALFAFPASALWALLPITAAKMGLGSAGYGFLLGSLGVGAIIGIFVLPIARRRLSDNVILVLSALLYAVGVVAAAFLPFGITLVLLALSGIAWIGTLTVLNAALQLTLPQWVRSRGAAAYILVFMGTMAAGSFVWGLVAQLVGTGTALAVTVVLLVGVAASIRFLPLLNGTGTVDRSISMSWPMPTLVFEPDPTDGPVTVLVRYRVQAADAEAFRAAMAALGSSRRRTGAARWRFYRSGEVADEFLEMFVVSSWSEYRRQQTERLTGRDREFRDAVSALCSSAPVESHYFPPVAVAR
ncbi:MFS transporter [Subtercola endophyticus]|uniref:MFS transporter n=1 Tax=Subtercola endophyticus TaxID=2895559 RepID=UPI001E31144D|nr:MFS transporter [Subtercola endophyticus]UFS59944.1 MFS transporter [Subtercola endophyticus]